MVKNTKKKEEENIKNTLKKEERKERKLTSGHCTFMERMITRVWRWWRRVRLMTECGAFLDPELLTLRAIRRTRKEMVKITTKRGTTSVHSGAGQ